MSTARCEGVKENWRHEEISSMWQITPQQLLIFAETYNPKLTSLSPFNEAASHDLCCPSRSN